MSPVSQLREKWNRNIYIYIGLQHNLCPLDDAQPQGPVPEGHRPGPRLRRHRQAARRARARARAGQLRDQGPGGRRGGEQPRLLREAFKVVFVLRKYKSSGRGGGIQEQLCSNEKTLALLLSLDAGASRFSTMYLFYTGTPLPAGA